MFFQIAPVMNEDNIEFVSSVSLSSLKQAFAQNFIHSDSESGEISSSSDGSSNDYISLWRRVRESKKP